jgi:hypothetical protein
MRKLSTKLLAILLSAPQILCCLFMVLGVCPPAGAAAPKTRPSCHDCCGSRTQKCPQTPEKSGDSKQYSLCGSWNAVISKRPPSQGISPFDLFAAPAFAELSNFESFDCLSTKFAQPNIRACSRTLLSLCCQFLN